MSFIIDLNVYSESLSVLFLAESSRRPEQNSGMHAWQMLYWRTVRIIKWSWLSVHIVRTLSC